jgi:hypothetical protein
MSLSKKAAQEAMIARQKAEIARLKTGKPGPEMPVMGRLPAPSSKEKAEQQKKLDAKIKANQPAAKPMPMPFKPDYTDPVMPRSPMVVPPRTGVLPSKPANAPMEQVEIDKQKAQAEMLAKQNYAPNPGVGKPTSPGMGGPTPVPKTPPPPVQSQPSHTGNIKSIPKTPPAPVKPAFAMKRGGAVKNKPAKYSSGGSVSKASSRGDGIAQRGKTKGRYI